jgi:hypothetical protein
MNELKKLIKNQYRIWTVSHAKRTKEYIHIVYKANEALAQFKYKQDAKLFMRASIDKDVANLQTDVEIMEPDA